MRPQRPPDSLADVPFPTGGIDLSTEFEEQNPGTTPTGQNVRAFEPSTQRMRGGSRPGLLQYIPAQVNGTAAIQCIDATAVTVDPSGMGGVVYGPQGPGTPGTKIPPIPGSPGDPNAGQGGDGSGGVGGFGQTFNDDRPGGSGHFGGTHNPITLVQYKTGATALCSAGIGGVPNSDVTSFPITFNTQIQQGNMLLVALSTQAGFAGPTTGSPTSTMVGDTLGNHFIAIAQLQATPFGSVSLWYCLSQASGSDSILIVNNQLDSVAAYCCEFHNVSSINPVDNFNTHTGSTQIQTSGALNVTGTQELAVAVFTNAGSSGIPLALGGFALPVDNHSPFVGNSGIQSFACLTEAPAYPGNGAFGLSELLVFIYKAGLSAGVNPSMDCGQGSGPLYGAIGATFKPR